jgi:penicillin-binding protein 1A
VRRWLWRWRRFFLAVGLVVVAGLAGLVYLIAQVELPSELPQARTSIVLDTKGRPLGEFHAGENRVPVKLDEVAAIAREAVLAAEDRDFYSHSGLSPRGIVRALWSDIRRRPLQGGSTITQQLVKNSYLDHRRTITRKLKEAVLAVKIERSLSKDAIFERYLNTVYFGRGAYGIETASRAYFGVSAAELDLPQAALLAGLIRAPETADPAERPEEARRRRRLVLRGMVETGAVTREESDAAGREPVGALERAAPETSSSVAMPYVLDYVRRWVASVYGDQLVYSGGLRVETTIDLDLQRAAEDAVEATLTEPDDPASALVSVDGGGGILAMVGGRDFTASQVNLAVGREGGGSGRQAGSAFKPFVLAAAIEAGVGLCERFPAPASVEFPIPGQVWRVRNYDGKGLGTIDLARATALSVNTVYARLIDRVGPEAVAEVAQRAGIRSHLDPIHSLALGTEPVSPLEMAGAYLTFSNRGERVEPFVVARIRDADGDVLYTRHPYRSRVIEEARADAVTSALRRVVEQGTGGAARLGRPAAGKTGTTQGYGDAWFVGYSSGISTAVWMGYPEGQSRAMDDVHGRRVSGGSFPAEIWERFMRVAVEGRPVEAFPEPPGDVACPGRRAPSTTAPDGDPSPTSTVAPTSIVAPTTVPPVTVLEVTTTTSTTTGPPTTTTTSPTP